MSGGAGEAADGAGADRTAGAAGRRGSFGGSIVALTGARLASVAAVFGAGVVAARLLDPAAVGVAAVGLTVGWAVAIIGNGGLNISAIYFLGRRPDQRRVLVGRVLGLGLAAVGFAGVVTVMVAPLVDTAVGGAPGAAVFVASGLLAAGTIGYEVTGATLLGLGRRGRYVMCDLQRSVGTLTAAVVVLGLALRTPAGYVLSAAVGVLVPTAYALLAIRREVGSLRVGFDREFTAEATRMGLAGQVGNVLTFLNVRLDQVLVPALAGLHAGGIYFIAARVAEVGGQVSTAAASMLFPQVAARTGERPDGVDHRADTALTEKTARFTLIGTVGVAAGLALVSPILLGVVFGQAYRVGGTALLLLLVAMVPLALARVLAADLKGRGRPGLVSIGTGTGMALLLALDLVLIPLLGIEGAALAAIVGQSVTAVILVQCYRRVAGGRVVALLPRPSDVRLLVRALMSAARSAIGARRSGTSESKGVV